MIVCATIIQEDKVLLVRHASEEKPDYGDWLLPAGSVKQGETPLEALQREIDEETSLRIKIVRKLAQHTDPYTKADLVNFLCIPLTSQLKISDELADAKWFGESEIKSLKNIHSGLAEFLTTILRNNALKHCESTDVRK